MDFKSRCTFLIVQSTVVTQCRKNSVAGTQQVLECMQQSFSLDTVWKAEGPRVVCSVPVPILQGHVNELVDKARR